MKEEFGKCGFPFSVLLRSYADTSIFSISWRGNPNRKVQEPNSFVLFPGKLTLNVYLWCGKNS